MSYGIELTAKNAKAVVEVTSCNYVPAAMKALIVDQPSNFDDDALVDIQAHGHTASGKNSENLGNHDIKIRKLIIAE